MKLVAAIVGLMLVASVAHAGDMPALAGAPGQWWSPMQSAAWAGSVGGSFGALIGILGGLSGWLAPRGQARGFVLAIWGVFLTISVITLLAGIVAVAVRQPVWVYAPLLGTGFIGTAVMGPLMPVISKRYEEAELRLMNAQDATEPARHA